MSIILLLVVVIIVVLSVRNRELNNIIAWKHEYERGLRKRLNEKKDALRSFFLEPGDYFWYHRLDPSIVIIREEDGAQVDTYPPRAYSQNDCKEGVFVVKNTGRKIYLRTKRVEGLCEGGLGEEEDRLEIYWHVPGDQEEEN